MKIDTNYLLTLGSSIILQLPTLLFALIALMVSRRQSAKAPKAATLCVAAFSLLALQTTTIPIVTTHIVHHAAGHPAFEIARRVAALNLLNQLVAVSVFGLLFAAAFAQRNHGSSDTVKPALPNLPTPTGSASERLNTLDALLAKGLISAAEHEAKSRDLSAQA